MGKKVFGLLLLNLFLAALSIQGVAAAFTPAVYVFGDSGIDVGNNNFLPKSPMANYTPYGIDFPGRIPTGRYSNGFNMIDFIAQGAGLDRSPPAYLSISNEWQMTRGVNFASGGSGILDSTGDGVVLSMNQQIKDFETVIAKMTAKMGNKFTSAFLKKSLFFVSTGSNDFAAFLPQLIPGNSTQKDEIVASLLQKYKHQLQTLYHLGARKFAVMSTTFVVGCNPLLRLGSPSGDCNEELSDICVRFKISTKGLLEELSASLQGFKYSLIDLNEIAKEIFSDPLKYGFTDIRSACCGSGRLNAEVFCLPNSTYCSDRDRHFWWDEVHPSMAAAKVIGELSLYGSPRFASPVNGHEFDQELE